MSLNKILTSIFTYIKYLYYAEVNLSINMYAYAFTWAKIQVEFVCTSTYIKYREYNFTSQNL